MKRRAAQPPRGPYTTPLRQLRRRLTFVFTVLTGTVLTVFLAITLGLAQKQTQLSAQSMFDASVDTLIVTLQTGSVSDTALAQTEAADGLLIFITDNGTPLFFSGGWAPATPRGTLLERAAEAGLAEGVNMDAAPRSSVYASRVTVTVEGNAGEHYTAAVCSVPGQRGWYGLAVLRDDGPLRRTLTRQALLYAALLSGGLALLGAVNWFLAGRALRPTAEALQKQREFVAAAGHEIASHGMYHEPVFRLGPRAFRQDAERSRKLLEDCCSTWRPSAARPTAWPAWWTIFSCLQAATRAPGGCVWNLWMPMRW